jgi:hypothetical protein
VTVDRPFVALCSEDALPGDLHEQTFAVQVPPRGRFHVAIQLYRDGKPRAPLTPAPVELGVVGDSTTSSSM